MKKSNQKLSIHLLLFLPLILIGCLSSTPVKPAPPLPSVTPEPIEQSVTSKPGNIPQEVENSPTNEELPIPDCLRGQKVEKTRVLRVIDGDTIEVSLNGEIEKVRYLLVDTPEMNASDKIPGQLAKEFNNAMVEGRDILLVRNTSNRDNFGRLLRFVISDGVFVNYELVRQGYAITFIRLPDDLCSLEFQDAMLEAFTARKGIWQNVQEIYNSSGNDCPEGCMIQTDGCLVKGNINGQKDKIFHLPGSEDYDEVVVNAEKGERWFCTIREAIQNGWRPARAD